MKRPFTALESDDCKNSCLSFILYEKAIAGQLVEKMQKVVLQEKSSPKTCVVQKDNLCLKLKTKDEPNSKN